MIRKIRVNNSNKLGEQNGSAMTLVIMIMAILLVFIPYATNQISNQYKSTKMLYSEIQDKYLAEAGIDKTISDIENQVNNYIRAYHIGNYSIEHSENDNCPKVEFDKNGNPNWGASHADSGNTFYKLILWELVMSKSNVIYNQVIQVNWQIIFKEDCFLREYYENNIRNFIENMTLVKDKSDIEKLGKNIDEFIGMIEYAKEKVEKSDADNSLKQTTIDGLDTMKGYMEEIKCRLGLSGTGTVEPPSLKSIEIPYYNVTLDNSDNIIFDKDNSKINRCNIDMIIKDGKIDDIDFSQLNSNLIGASAINYKVNTDIDFIYVKDGFSYSIEQSINSYERIK